ncbi:DNA helicase II/ATP-dependent DNA helicase PcrA [Candidatus Kinetoplastibacterium desouzaii TCC079E]|uniref:DNA 3'-5' helicase n=1 Tax=Candidatus Kinetoplastidibacterium desouzai TCC079E TaxID=1208919 RepID=M1LRM9_9PROT|nr:UvrD-helicase domain-containing protein [Candidatus Kinetoplastibacterium desouzaii]AGF46791.1 DNA helicase II/ATP-dependent DNA helicase PcrA [Candidatus Kinetoplastibacterium desouzaii TCC079E]
MNLNDLNAEQEKAVTTGSSHTLVLAGAGSGKTKVLSSRMAWLLNTKQATTYDILAVTFTNKAAKEMISRVSSMLTTDIKGLWIGTFHGLCHKMLRIHWRESNLLQSFQIIDMSDQLSLIKRIIKSNDVNESKNQARDLQKFINYHKEYGIRSSKVEVYDSYSKKLTELYQEYEIQCSREGLVDFSELLLKSYELLKSDDNIRNYYQDRFRFILVDEFQDTNNLQYEWLRLLIGKSTSVFAVGDDDQSIYAFRGANVGNISLFDKYYAKGNIIRLEQNYRSLGHILGAANSLIKNNTGRLGKKLWTQSGDGDKVSVVETFNDSMESQWVVDEIKKLVKNNKVNPDEIAILYRSNAQSRVLEHAFFSRGVSYKVYGGLRFFERQEIKHALAYLRLIVNSNDNNSWIRVVNFPIRGIGPRTLDSLWAISREYDVSLYDAVKYYQGKSRANLVAFNNIINSLKELSNKLTLSSLVEYLLDFTGINSYYQNSKEESDKDRLENLKELVTAAMVFSTEDGYIDIPASSLLNSSLQDSNVFIEEKMTPLLSFLSHASLEAGDGQIDDNQPSVQLMTVHAAKGLEFRVVFITGVEEGLFPHENSVVDSSSVEEERRLMYVAITRAKEKLYITMANSRMLRGQTRYSSRSRFIQEIDNDHINFIKKQNINNVNVINKKYVYTDTLRANSNNFKSVASEVSVNNNKFYIGQHVRHKSFGDGVIVKLIGSGDDCQAQINFTNSGVKTIMLRIAKFE